MTRSHWGESRQDMSSRTRSFRIVPRRLTNVAADKHFRMRLRRNGDSVLAAELRR